MKIFLVLMLLAANLAFGQAYHSDKPSAWIDLTGKKFEGSDEELHGFRIVSIETGCDSLYQKCAVSWKTKLNRMNPFDCSKNCAEEPLKSYTMHFNVKDRHGDSILKKSVKWDSKVQNKKEGYVGRYDTFISLGNINLGYSTVEYWAEDIKWDSKIKPKRKKDSGRSAFSIKSILGK